MSNFLNRFTKTSFALQMLKDEKLLLPRPDTWLDKNDVIPLQYYRIKKEVLDLFALCFTHQRETVYHWYIDSDISSTCCIEFNKEEIEKTFEKNGCIFKEVQYESIRNLPQSTYTVDDIPFLKRLPYANEKEYRVIWCGDENKAFKSIKIGPQCIERIIVGSKSSKQAIKDIISKKSSEWGKIKICATTLEYNQTWIKNTKTIINKKQ